MSNLLIPYEIEGKTLTGKCVIEHTPMKWNFWHFSIRWLNADAIYLHVQDEKLFKRGGWVRQLSSAARAMLVQFADLKEPNYYIIPKACYLVDNHFA